MKRLKLNYQKRLFFYNILLFVLPFMVVALLIVHLAITEVNTRTNRAHVAVLEQMSEHLSGVFQEITYFSNIFYWDTTLNGIISDRSPLKPYQQASDNRAVADLFRINMYAFDRYQYGVTILGTNRKHYTSLYETDERALQVLLDEFSRQEWYQAAAEKKGQLVYLPEYQAKVLADYAPETMVFAVRQMHNLISGRAIGAMIIGIRSNYLGDIFSRSLNMDTQNLFVMDEQGMIFYASQPEFLNQDLKLSDYYRTLVEHDSGYFLARVGGEKAQVVFVTNPVTGWKLVMYTPVRLFNQNWNLLFQFIIVITMIYFCIALFMSYYNAKIISKPVKNLSAAMARLQEGDVTVRTEILYEDELGQLSRQFNQTAERIGELLAALEENEARKRTLEIQALQAQINPHFLYNTLASIRFMLEMDMVLQANEALVSLVKLLKKIFSGSGKLVNLAEEFETAEHYLSLLKLRHNDDFVWEIKLEDDISQYQILKFILQPLVENSVTHGFNERVGGGRIWLTGRKEDGDIVIRVADNGTGADIDYVNRLLTGKEEQAYTGKLNGIGMKNVHDRLRLFFGEAYGLQVFPGEDGGLVVQVRIPQIFPEDEGKERGTCG